MTYLLGIHMDAEGTCAAVYDMAGRMIGRRYTILPSLSPRPGWAEQDAGRRWDSVVASVRGAVVGTGIVPRKIQAMSMSASSSTVLALDDYDAPLRTAILHTDRRATEETAAIEATGASALRYCGDGYVPAEWGLPKAMWIKRHEPRVFLGAATICETVDWLVHRLTGMWTMSVAHAAGRYFYNSDFRGWPVSMYEKLGALDILEKFPPYVVQVGEPVGPLIPHVAEELGLAPNTLVVQGCISAYAEALSLGVADAGSLALLSGRDRVVTGQLAAPLHARGLWGSFTDSLIPGLHTVEARRVSLDSAVEQLGKKFFRTGISRRPVLQALVEDAGNVPIGSDGLVFFDDSGHVDGPRDVHGIPPCGSFRGMTSAHTDAHLMRALLEGICWETESILKTIGEASPIDVLVASRTSMGDVRMQADISNRPIAVRDVEDGPTLGSAMAAAAGAGMYPDLRTSSREMTGTFAMIEPDSSAHCAYRSSYERHRVPLGR